MFHVSAGTRYAQTLVTLARGAGFVSLFSSYLIASSEPRGHNGRDLCLLLEKLLNQISQLKGKSGHKCKQSLEGGDDPRMRLKVTLNISTN